MGKYSVFYIEFGINPSFVYVCLLLCNIFVNIYNCLANYGVVLLLCVDGWVDHWCTDVFLVWRIPYRNAAALLPKSDLRNDQLLHRGLQVLHH
jgi:hypothetical protein